jgi:hypothetical protein
MCEHFTVLQILFKVDEVSLFLSLDKIYFQITEKYFLIVFLLFSKSNKLAQ